MTFLGLEARTDLPKVAYPTALDFFVFLSFVFIFATILQFAIVHYFTKYGSGECYFNFHEDSSSDTESEEEHLTLSSSHLSSMTQCSVEMYGVIPLSRLELDIDDLSRPQSVKESFKKIITKYLFCVTFFKRSIESDQEPSESVDGSIVQCEEYIDLEVSATSQRAPQCQRHSSKVFKQSRSFRRNFNSVSKIDKFSRISFPMLFFFINMLYWIFYLSRSQRK